MAELTKTNKKNKKSSHNTRKGRYNVHGLNFDIDDMISEYKENIAEALHESKPTSVKKEIILMIDNHGQDLPGDILDPSLTRQVRMCVSGASGIPYMSVGIYKDKLLDAFYEAGIHKIGLSYRKKIVENTIKLHSAQYTKTYSFSQTGEELKRRYLRLQQEHTHLLEQNGLKLYMNMHVKHIKPVIDHKYYTGNFHGCTDINRKSGVIDEKIFGMFTIISSTEPEDQEYTLFGCCASDDKSHLDYNKATANPRDKNYRKFDLFKWITKNKIRRPFKEFVVPKFILLSDILTVLKEKYDNVYIIDNTCRSISNYMKNNPDKQINFKQLNLNELSKGSYSPQREADNRRAAEN
jgi:hypothetical protein